MALASTKPWRQDVNVESLKEYDYFTYAKVNGAKTREPFDAPTEYWLDYDAEVGTLTLHFTLALKTPMRAKSLDIEVYDPELFVYFAFAEKDAVRLAGAPAQCKAMVARSGGAGFPFSLRNMFKSSEANAGSGAQFAEQIAMRCP